MQEWAVKNLMLLWWSLCILVANLCKFFRSPAGVLLLTKGGEGLA